MVVLIGIVFVLSAGVAMGAQQLVSTHTLVVRIPENKILWRAKDVAGSHTIVGDPTQMGASWRLKLVPGGEQCFTMPSPGWAPIGSIGYQYSDPNFNNGPVQRARIKLSPTGTFLIKVLITNKGGHPVTIVPGQPTLSYEANFTVHSGDEYCSGTGTVPPKRNDGTKFHVSHDTAPLSCPITPCAPCGTVSAPSCDDGLCPTGICNNGGGFCACF